MTPTDSRNTLVFAHKTPEGISFWPKLREWRSKNNVLKATRAARLPTQSMSRRRRQQMEAAQQAADELRDHAIDALAAAYKIPDIREEYEPELLALARELGLSRRQLDRHAIGPHRISRQDAFQLTG